MKTLSVRQPWAWLIVNGYKTVENRTWRTSYRGPLAIHAPQRIEHEIIPSITAKCESDGEPLTAEELMEMHVTGAVVGVVDLVDCTSAPDDPGDREWHDPGQIAWILRNPRILEPAVPARGRLGLYEISIPHT